MGFFLETLKLRLFGLTKIPLVFFCRPSVVRIDDDGCELKIPLRRRTKNHVGSLYIGAYTVGADLCVGLMAMHQTEKVGGNVVVLFKDFKADYKKLAKNDVHFICKEGGRIKALVEAAIRTKERQNATIHGFAVVPKIDPNDAVMEFDITLSLKVK